ncbi:hypothetical protein AEAC466_03505 [Asticcacaulis sp. AC466]|uniref:hypothetical protein n=1 Tax=Asticcacaulis sp. AC466 TaxID=1282362 RepID=UPI0003C3D522|nr:hypothetical protein [Asticcacaulis sp. AC466]ESQ86276.1 hypothetical protein AEAC466_03505 [Asticcacaulis sp. AC466]
MKDRELKLKRHSRKHTARHQNSGEEVWLVKTCTQPPEVEISAPAHICFTRDQAPETKTILTFLKEGARLLADSFITLNNERSGDCAA